MIDWLVNAANFGKRLTYREQQFVILHVLENGYYLAVRENVEMPAEVYLIHDDSYEEAEKREKDEKEQKCSINT